MVGGRTKKRKRATSASAGGEEVACRIVDKDSTVGGDFDLCDRCDCPRSLHEDGAGECAVCGTSCGRFKE